MQVLIPENIPFELNQPTHNLIDAKMCVFDCSNKEYKDFFFKKITNFILYRYPTVLLKIYNEKTSFYLNLPLNWKIAVTNDNDYICDLINVEELVHFDHTLPVFNPLHIGIPTLMKIKIVGIIPTMVEHFVPRLPKKNLLVIPLGIENQWHKITENGEERKFPPCILAVDDVDVSKISFDYFEDIVGD